MQRESKNKMTDNKNTNLSEILVADVRNFHENISLLKNYGALK